MAFVTYTNTGPFTNNVAPPGVNATFLNNVETFLDQITASAVADANVTANGSGVLTAVNMKAIFKSIGGGHTLQDWNFGFQAVVTTGTIITHGLKTTAGAAAQPGAIFVQNGSNTGGVTFAVLTVGTTTFTIVPTSNVNAWWIAVLA